MAGISSIIIDQQFAALGIEVTPAQMKITTQRQQMEISRERPEMSLEYRLPEFKLNWGKVRAESGLKPPSDMARTIADKGSAGARSGTSEAANDGDYLGNVKAGGNRVAQLSRHKTIKTAQAEINLSSMPQSLPEVEWSAGVVNINWTKGALNVDWTGDYMPEIVIDPPFSIEIFLREKPYIKIMVEDGAAPAGPGSIIDARL